LPQTGPEDWLKYLQIGLGVLGAGALLLLFL
jgi:LPXTG-motif cell wall-anchored protein